MAAELEHYGVKGMRWGVRRSSRPTAVQVRQKPGKYVRTSGGNRQKASDDAIRARSSKQKAKRSTTDSLSNKELQELVTRLNLERQYRQLKSEPHRLPVGARIVTTLLGQQGIRDLAITSIPMDPATKATVAGVSKVLGAAKKK